MAKVAVLALSFSLRDEEPNPCNVRLAEETQRICRDLLGEGHAAVLAAQWEVGLALPRQNRWPYLEVDPRNDGKYLDTNEVFAAALEFFRAHGATRIVVVANPFIHQPYAYWLAHKHFRPMWRRVRWIGFDRQSTQWWCRSWWSLVLYTLRTALGFQHGHGGRQAKI